MDIYTHSDHLCDATGCTLPAIASWPETYEVPTWRIPLDRLNGCSVFELGKTVYVCGTHYKLARLAGAVRS